MITNRLITNNIKFQKDSSCLHSAFGKTNLTISRGARSGEIIQAFLYKFVI